MSIKKFIYFLVELDGKSRQVVNGVVVSLNTPKQLAQAPDGNQEIAIGWERSGIYYGNIKTFSLPLGFVMDGALILRNDFYKFNLDRRLFLLIKRLTYEYTPTTFKEYYKQLYKGELDWSTADDSQGDYRFNIGILEGGLQKQLKSKENQDYEIPFDEDSKNVIMDGMFITGTFRWFMPEYNNLADGYPGMYQLPNDNAIPGFVIFDVQQDNATGAPDQDTLTYFGEFTQDINDVLITGLIPNNNQLGAPGPLSIRIYVWNTISGTLRLTLDLTPADPYPENYNLIVNETIDFLQGDRVFFKAGGPYSEGNWSLNAKSKPNNSTIKGFTLYDIGLKLIEKITGSSANFESALLAAKNIIVTSGDGVRGLDKAAVKTNWRDYWKAVDVYCKAQLTITDKIRIEARETAYDSTQVPIPLGEVKNFKSNPAIDLLATSVKVGHQDPQVDDTNGKFDFNSSMIFSTPIKTIPDKQLDLQSPWKASPWEIEQMRANYEGKTTTDKTTDNDVYVLAVLPATFDDTFSTTASFFADGAPLTPGAPLLGIVAPSPKIVAGMKLRITDSVLNSQDVTVKSAASWFFGQLIITNEALVDEPNVIITIEIIEGDYYELDRTPEVTQLLLPPDDVDQDTKDSLFNVPLSPKRILLLHKTWIAGIVDKYTPGSLEFSSVVRNKEMISDGIIEKADVPIADLGAPMFLPYYWEFDTISPVDMTALLDANPNPVFSFIWKFQEYTGFFIRGGIALNDLEEQTFKLLACPENNVLNLI